MQAVSAQVIVNEFLFRDSDAQLEFVELFNRSEDDVDLSRISISDERKVPVPITASAHPLHPGDYAVLVRDSLAFDARFNGPRIEVPSWPALNNGGDAIFVWIAGAAVDSVFFDGDWGAYGQSLERVDPNAPAMNPSNWRVSTDPSGGTPGSENSVYRPDRTAPSLVEAEEWIDGYVIAYVSEPLDPASLQSTDIRFGSGDRPISARLSSDHRKIIVEPWSGADLAALTVEGLVDASGNVAGREIIAVARQPRAAEVIINEILFEPKADAFDGAADQLEFVEIRSVAEFPIAMRGMYLSGVPTEKGVSDTLRSDNSPRRLHAGGYGYFHASGTDATPFREAFPSTPPDSVSASAPVRRQSLLLDNHGDTVKLHAAGGELLDGVTYSPRWHLPELPSTTGVSLERIAAESHSNDPGGWTSSVSGEGGTPGRVNSVSVSNRVPGQEWVSISPSPFSPDGDGWEDFTQIDVRIGRPASSIAVWIFDSAGRMVRSLTDARAVGPEASLIWDGRDDAARAVSPGVFIVYVEVVDTSAGDVLRVKRPVVVASSR